MKAFHILQRGVAFRERGAALRAVIRAVKTHVQHAVCYTQGPENSRVRCSVLRTNFNVDEASSATRPNSESHSMC